jgi:hypothetical protein
MKAYRILVASAGHVPEPVLDLICVDDGEALIRCHEVLSSHDTVEAWDGVHLVCRMMAAGTAKTSIR